ncbi:hypothetical protein EsDP_00003881 [Epichloe bromicola]|uniref:Uncharacterized protein n=1 Tax=Epichloe bromicola TaxID=79588 RepID=A0ABQ0CQ55_9HYPO
MAASSDVDAAKAAPARKLTKEERAEQRKKKMGPPVRLQMRKGDAPKSMSGTFVHIVKTDGPLALYSGISASLLRQLTYSTVRFGVYEELKARYTRTGGEPTFPVLSAMAVTSGFLGGIAGNFADVLIPSSGSCPIDVIKTRVMSSTQKQGIIRLVGDIYKTDGLRWMFKGWVPSFLRLGPHTICTFVFLEMHRKTYRKVKGLDEQKL